MIFVTFLWRGHGFRTRHKVPSYGAQHVAALASMLHRHGGHTLVCATDWPEAASVADDWLPMPPEVVWLPGYYPKLWAWSAEFGEAIGSRFALIDLDCVILDNPATAFSGSDLSLWDYARDELYNTSLVAMNPGARRQVWDRFSLQAAAEAEARASRWTGDQSWVGHVLGPGERTFGEAQGVWCYRPMRDRAKPPQGARAMFCCGPYSPDIEASHSAWVKEAWR